ncbi:unnamed protein product [Symbiodinium natans]|uniref:Uncharacterized protein n=1 Tax=Symbiodinium natans TaxID=878477 RepID=A0A812T7N4_9DINO|nr:unnamed protein product [Symbiodinium natans]
MALRGLRSCHEFGVASAKEELKRCRKLAQLAGGLHPDVSPASTKSRGNFVEAEASAVEPFPTLSKAKVVGAKHSWGGVAGVAAGAAGAARASPGLTWIAGTATSTSTTPSQATPGTPSKNYQGQPWKWRIKGPLTISAQKKGKGFRR